MSAAAAAALPKEKDKMRTGVPSSDTGDDSDSSGDAAVPSKFETNVSSRKLTTLDGMPELQDAKCRSLNCSFNNLKSLRSIARLKQLQHMRGHHNILESLAGLESLCNLVSLYLQHNQLESIGNALSKCSRLQFLNLDDNRLASLEGLSLCPSLVVVSVAANRISAIHPSHVGACAALEELNLQLNPLAARMDLSALFRKNTRLRDLDLGGSNIEVLTGSLKGSSSLKELSLRNCRKLSSLEGCDLTGLEVLNVEGCPSTAALGNLSVVAEVRREASPRSAPSNPFADVLDMNVEKSRWELKLDLLKRKLKGEDISRVQVDELIPSQFVSGVPIASASSASHETSLAEKTKQVHQKIYEEALAELEESAERSKIAMKKAQHTMEASGSNRKAAANVTAEDIASADPSTSGSLSARDRPSSALHRRLLDARQFAEAGIDDMGSVSHRMQALSAATDDSSGDGDALQGTVTRADAPLSSRTQKMPLQTVAPSQVQSDGLYLTHQSVPAKEQQGEKQRRQDAERELVAFRAAPRRSHHHQQQQQQQQQQQ